LSQAYENLELLIMDDASPDDTPEVASSLYDPRIRYVRNETNLGNIENYNKGISLARGEHVWLISADDLLRSVNVLERYVQLMDTYPRVGYVFCPAVAIHDGQEMGVMEFSVPAPQDTIFKGVDFLQKLLNGNCVSAPAAMARKECYDQVSFFPANMSYAGDWYLWCMFAFHYDVGYFAEPMVNRRLHNLNMSKFFMKEGRRTYVANQIEIPWLLKYKAEASGSAALLPKCTVAIVSAYIQGVLDRLEQDSNAGISVEEFEKSVEERARSLPEAVEIRAKVYAGLGDYYYWKGDTEQASNYYRQTVLIAPRRVSAFIKYILLHLGPAGKQLRGGMGALRR
jgi:glycosyltransferase involved in cell wall biosynthesis